MKDLNDLLQQFDDLQELPVSEETVGAYMEGNLGGSELRELQNILNSDADFYGMIESVGEIDNGMDMLIRTPISGVESPDVLNFHFDNLIDVHNDSLSEASLTFSNGETIFEMDFGQLDAIEHQNPSDNHNNVGGPLPDNEQFNLYDNDITTNEY